MRDFLGKLFMQLVTIIFCAGAATYTLGTPFHEGFIVCVLAFFLVETAVIVATS